MKLYIVQLDGDGVNGKSLAIYNENGERMKCIRSATVKHSYGDAARLELELVVNGRDIAFGMPPGGPKVD